MTETYELPPDLLDFISNSFSPKQLADIVVYCLSKHPDWLASIVMAMQQGLAQALMDERTRSANLAYGFVDLVILHQTTAKKRAVTISHGLEELARFFDGAPVAETIRSLLPAND